MCAIRVSVVTRHCASWSRNEGEKYSPVGRNVIVCTYKLTKNRSVKTGKTSKELVETFIPVCEQTILLPNLGSKFMLNI